MPVLDLHRRDAEQPHRSARARPREMARSSVPLTTTVGTSGHAAFSARIAVRALALIALQGQRPVLQVGRAVGEEHLSGEVGWRAVHACTLIEQVSRA